MAANKLNTAAAVRIRELTAGGVRRADIAKAFGVSENAVFNVIHRIAWPLDEDPPDPFSGVSADQLRADYAGGLTQRGIAAKYCTTTSRVWRTMRRFGIDARPSVVPVNFGPANPRWGGDSVSKIAFHKRLYTRFGKPSRCSVCGKTDAHLHFDYANLTGRYEDVEDYTTMCRSCHFKYDKIHLNFRRDRRSSHARRA